MTPLGFACSSGPSSAADDALIDRLVVAYRRGVETSVGSSDSMWLDGPLLEMRRDVHDALIGSDGQLVRRLLRDPAKTDLFNGFEALNRTYLTHNRPFLDEASFAAGEFYNLLQLGRALGVARVTHHDQPEPPPPDLEDLLASIEARLGCAVEFPNPFADEIGLATTRGIVSYRAPAAIYQAWRIRQLVGDRPHPRVLEIGGGLGRTAYYARSMGVTDYTIVDLPITLAAQADFLGRVLGEDKIRLFGEVVEETDRVKLLPPSSLFNSNEHYDLVLNVDSMTEMARETSEAYCEVIKARADIFLSINHEGLAFTVAELMPDRSLQRFPYWLRPGYVEEVGLRRETDDAKAHPHRIAYAIRAFCRSTFGRTAARSEAHTGAASALH